MNALRAAYAILLLSVTGWGQTDWPTYNGDYSGRRYSTLANINQSNINALSLAWIYRAPQLASSEANNGKQPAAAQAFSAPPSQPIQSAAPPSQ